MFRRNIFFYLIFQISKCCVYWEINHSDIYWNEAIKTSFLAIQHCLVLVLLVPWAPWKISKVFLHIHQETLCFTLDIIPVSALPCWSSVCMFVLFIPPPPLTLMCHCCHSCLMSPSQLAVTSPRAACLHHAAPEAAGCTAGAWTAPPACPVFWPSQSISERQLIFFPCRPHFQTWPWHFGPR